MIQLDGFVHYDPQTLEKTQQSLKPEQISWLEETLARSDARWRILAYHYDYSRQVLANLADMGVDAFFYGHSKTHDSRYFENGARNGHLPGDSAYRLVEATAESLQLGLAVSFAELGVEE
jgi:phosphodiesterase/alkaline phosphatase D-like protein